MRLPEKGKMNSILGTELGDYNHRGLEKVLRLVLVLNDLPSRQGQSKSLS